MKIILSGASGLIGGHLSNKLIERGFRVAYLKRQKFNNQSGKKDLTSIKKTFWANPEILNDADVVVHLAGANVAKRWTNAYREEISNSRLHGSLALLWACAQQPNPPKHIISASGIGYYPEGLPTFLEENHEAGKTFLADVCKAWESSLTDNSCKTTMISVVRTGLVLSENSKIIEACKQQFMISGMIGSVGSPKNMWSWIHIDDLCNIYIALILNQLPTGIYNGVAPNPCQQGIFALAMEQHYPWLGNPINKIGPALSTSKLSRYFIGSLINRFLQKNEIKARPILPSCLIKIIWGKRAAIALTNQCVSSVKTTSAGFCFLYPSIDKAVANLTYHK